MLTNYFSFYQNENGPLGNVENPIYTINMVFLLLEIKF